MQTISATTTENVSELLPSFLVLLGSDRETVNWNEMHSLGVDIKSLTRFGFLTHRTIASEVLIDDDDLGPVEARVVPDLGRNSADLGLNDSELLQRENLDVLKSWTINRAYVWEQVLERFRPMKLDQKPTDLGHGLLKLGSVLIGGDRRPVYLWEDGGNVEGLAKVDRLLRERRDRTSGLVFSPTKRPIAFIGKYLVLAIEEVLSNEAEAIDPDQLDSAWREGRAPASSAHGVEWDNHGDCAVLIIPGNEPWTITGAHRVELVRKLFNAWKQGQAGCTTADLVRHTESTGLEAVFGKEWRALIRDRYIFSPKHGNWALKVPPA